MVPKHLKKSDENLGGDQGSSMASNSDPQENNKSDKSVLRQPVDTGVRGVRDLMKAVVGGTEELRDILLNECSIIYECKVCRNMFRSLANFVSHKRIYCVKKFNIFTEATTTQKTEYLQQNDAQTQTAKCNRSSNLTETKLVIKVTNDEIVPNIIETEANSSGPSRRFINPLTRKCDIAKIADELTKRALIEKLRSPEEMANAAFYSALMRSKESDVGHLHEDDSSNSSGFFPSSNESGDNNQRDSLRLEETDRLIPGNEAVLQENGTFRVTPQGMQLQDNANLQKYKCSLCETHFMSQQTLNRHVQIHHKERICYPCPICRTYFPSPSSTYRHLSKDHHKTEQQIRRLRPKVLAKARKRKLVDGSSKSDVGTDVKTEWIPQNSNANVEVLYCDSCGKQFNRKAVLRVHMTSCKKLEPAKEVPRPSSASQTPKKPRVKTPPPANDSKSLDGPRRKSGILVRRDYCKKFNCNTMTFMSCRGNEMRGNYSGVEQSIKKVTKWKSVLKKLQTKTETTSVVTSENSDEKSDSK